MNAWVTPPQGSALAALAAAVIGVRLSGADRRPEQPRDEALHRPGASFVTLERRGRLRGCVGTLDPVRPLWVDVAENAARAMVDPRFPPLGPVEWDDLDVVVSVLSRPERIEGRNLAELAAFLRPGVDGLILTDGSRRATFLPSVWHKLPEPQRFIDALLAKGGWSTTDPPPLNALRYTAVEYSDPGPRGAFDE